MKFFTLGCYNDWSRNGKDDALRTAWARYMRHLEGLQGVLPAEVLALARLPGVDDGLVVEVQHQRLEKILTLVLRCGDQQMGYYDLVITYEGVSLTPQDERTLARVARTTRDHRRHESDLAYHEVDVAETASGGGIEHRFLFHPGVWFAVRCSALHWKSVHRPDRLLPRLPDRFPGGPSTAPEPVPAP